MNQEVKNSILSIARDHVGRIRSLLEQYLESLRIRVSHETFKKISKLPPDERLARMKAFEYDQARVEELEVMYPSPYFVRCEVRFDDSNEIEVWYFGKFQLSDESILSWASPAATVRFENPGKVSYTKPDGSKRLGTLLRKDQYMIIKGIIIFLSTEAVDTPRELIHQEYFAARKSEFALPEIVAQMEKAQDHVIRAHHKGPLVISGPAGSGKTTLALHRIAYLVQSPDTASLYPKEQIMVLVQDNGTKEYFSHVLPELGISHVLITTFSEWAMRLLEIKYISYVYRYGTSEVEKDHLEYAKLLALRVDSTVPFNSRIFDVLRSVYRDYFSKEQLALFSAQENERVLDRFDLTLLLRLFQNAHGSLSEHTTFFEETRTGKLIKKTGRKPLSYALMVVDEFQNYLPQQLSLLKSVIDPRLQSIVYVGDMAQQTQLETVTDWSAIDESIEVERHVVLSKVYRNTEQILRYIQSLGFIIEIPKGVKIGPEVVEKLTTHTHDEISYIEEILKENPTSSIGILARDAHYLTAFRDAFAEHSQVHIFTMSEAQGVEFEIVCLVGIGTDVFDLNYSSQTPKELIAEKKKVNRDLLYVALTRAISELHVLGTEKLSKLAS